MDVDLLSAMGLVVFFVFAAFVAEFVVREIKRKDG